MAKCLDCQITGLAILNGAHSKNGHLTEGYIEEPRLSHPGHRPLGDGERPRRRLMTRRQRLARARRPGAAE
jgi:hypothetical protein